MLNRDFYKEKIIEELVKIQSDEDRAENILKMFEKLLTSKKKNFKLSNS